MYGDLLCGSWLRVMPRRQLSSAKSAVRSSTSSSRGCFSTARIASRSSVVSATPLW